MRLDRRVKDLLKRAGATLKSSKKHLVFEVPGHRNVVLSHSPSDRNAVHQQVRDLTKIVGKEEPVRREPAEKRAKPGRYGEPRHKPSPPPFNAMADQLRAIGTVEAALREEIRSLNFQADMVTKAYWAERDRTVGLKNEVIRLRGLRAHCWMCRFRDWMKSVRRRGWKATPSGGPTTND